MKNAHTIDLDEEAYVPTFWKKPWLKKALKELNLSKMASDDRLAYELNYARLIGLAQQEEIEDKIKEARIEAMEREREAQRIILQKERDAQRDAERTRETIINFLEVGVDIDKIAKATKQSIDYVLDIKNQMQAEK
jgi:hypothetical protein